MIMRVQVLCPGCDSRITLRLSVGAADHQSFYYVCGKCNAATRAKVDASRPPGIGLELEDGEQVFGNEPTEQTITIDPTIPVRAGVQSMFERGGSPFIFMFQSLGEEKLAILQRANREFPAVVRKDWRALERLCRYYLDRNWVAFDRGLGSLWPEENSPVYDWQRHDAIHILFDLLTAPVWGPTAAYPGMKGAWNGVVRPSRENEKQLREAVGKFSRDAEVRELQEILIDCLRLFVTQHEAWLPGLAVTLLPESQSRDELRVFRDDFPALRDLYIRVFEACHRALNVLVPLLNLMKRGDSNSYYDRVALEKVPRTRAQFSGLKAASKELFVVELPVWEEQWSVLLDRKVRNLIGHAKIRHDLASGQLVTPTERLSYAVFLSKTHLLIQPLLAVLNAIKLPLVYSAMLEGE